MYNNVKIEPNKDPRGMQYFTNSIPMGIAHYLRSQISAFCHNNINLFSKLTWSEVSKVEWLFWNPFEIIFSS